MTTIELQYAPPAAVIRLSRPEVRNAISSQTIAEVNTALAEISRKREVAGVVITGAGDSFSAGADLQQLRTSQASGADHALRDSENFMRFLLRIHSFPKPVVAAVNGPAIGGGCGLATVCDLVIASERAVFGYAEVKIGFVPALVSVFLTRITGEKKARELLLTGRTFSASEAEEIGLVNRVVSEEELLPSAKEMVSLIAQNSPEAISMTKELLTEVSGLTLREALSVAAAKNALSRYSGDFEEGIAAFLEKRSARFRNK